MKKFVAVTLIVVFVLAMGMMAFAETTKVDVPEWFSEMIQWKKDQVKQAVEDKTITEEQGEAWNTRLDAMEKFHEENGFAFPGGCGGSGRGYSRGGSGFGPGMMGGRWNTQGF